jgi:hypothetical protein
MTFENLIYQHATRVKVLIILIITTCIITTAFADNVITSGTSVTVTSGTTVVSVGNSVIKNGATLNNKGSMILKKDFNNENISPNALGNGNFEFSGTTLQTTTGLSIFQNLSINNNSNVIVGGNTAVNGMLSLIDGRLVLGSSNLSLGALANVSGFFSTNAMIVATGTGEVKKAFPTGFTGSFYFPIGDLTGSAEYSPVTVTITGAAFSPSNSLGINLVNEKYPDPAITGNYLNRYWNLSQTGISNLDCKVLFNYLPADITGDEGMISCVRVGVSPWVTYSQTNATLHQLTANGTQFQGTFTGLKSTSTPSNQTLSNILIGDGVSTCYAATQILTVAGDGTYFKIENGGSATLIAGSKILFLPGTRVNYGGYIHGYISTNGNYCTATPNQYVANAGNVTESVEGMTDKGRSIRIYPNPTSDVVNIEFASQDIPDDAEITLYNMQGEKLIRKLLRNESSFQLSLSGKPTGMYLVHIQSGDKHEIARVVKR